jgi:hypothetical protein
MLQALETAQPEASSMQSHQSTESSMSYQDDDKDKKPSKVGYKKPPVHSRWPKGRSGNPSGKRKKLTLLDINKDVQGIYLKKVRVHRGNKAVYVPKLLALIEKKVNEAFDDQSGRLLAPVLKLAREFGVFQFVDKRELDLSVLTPEEREIWSQAAELAYRCLR